MKIRARFVELWNPEDLLDSLWSILASPYITMLLLLSLAVLVCLGMILPQRPMSTTADPVANALWLAALRERYRNAADWLLGLGLLDVPRSLWFRGLLGLLAFNLTLGIVDCIRPRYWWHADWQQNARVLVGALPAAESVRGFIERVRQVLHGQRFRCMGRSDERLLYADRFTFVPMLVYIGLLLVIAGLALSERTAWWEESIALRPGQVRPLSHGKSLALRAEVIPALDSKSGRSPYEGIELIFLQADREIEHRILYQNVPSFYAGLLFYASGTEPILLVQAQDKTGHNLPLQMPETGATQFTELALRFQEEESPRYIVMLNLTPGNPLGRSFQQRGNEKYVLVPDRDLTLRVLYNPPSPDENAPTFHVQAFRNAETSPSYQQQIQTASSVEIADDLYTFRPQHYAVIKFGQDYGVVLVFIGAAMVLTGMVLSIWHPPERVWLLMQVAERTVELYLTTNVAASLAPQWLAGLAQDLAAALHLNMPSRSTALDEALRPKRDVH